MTGYESKRAAARHKVIVTDLDGHVVRDVQKPKKVAALDRDAEIERLNEKIEFLARTNMLYSDWEHRDTQVTSELIRKGIEASKLNAELRAEIERLKQRTWVGLTDDEIDQGLLRTNYAMQTAHAWRDGVEWASKQLQEKNT